MSEDINSGVWIFSLAHGANETRMTGARKHTAQHLQHRLGLFQDTTIAGVELVLVLVTGYWGEERREGGRRRGGGGD